MAGSPPRRSLGGTATREEIAGGHWTEEVEEEGLMGSFFVGGVGGIILSESTSL